MASSPAPDRRKALAFAVGVCAGMFLSAFLVSHSPLPEAERESAVGWVLSPLTLITGAISRLVDLAGPGGGIEPASMQLPPWATWLIVALALVALITVLFFSSMAFQDWRRRQLASK